jgi:hypothetical protein
MKIKKINVPRIIFLTGSLSLVIIYVLSWVEVISDPVQRTASDFMAFYAAGRSMFTSTPAEAYDLTHLKLNEENVLGFKIADQDVNPFVHPPFILPILWLVAHFGYVAAFYGWAVFILVLCALCAQMALKLSPATSGSSGLVLWAGVFLFFPLFISLVNGQDSALLLLGAMIWYYGLTIKSDKTAGLGLALTVIRPQVALMLAIPFFFNTHHRKVWWWFCLGGSVLAILSMLLIGVHGVQNFINILSISAGGEGYKINESAMFNLIGFIKRLLPAQDAADIRMVGWIGTLTGLFSLCMVWRKSSNIAEQYISLAVITAIFTSPHLHYHDLALLVIPLLVVIRRLVESGKAQPGLASLIPIFVSFIFIFSYSILQLVYPVVYLVELSLLISAYMTRDIKA